MRIICHTRLCNILVDLIACGLSNRSFRQPIHYFKLRCSRLFVDKLILSRFRNCESVNMTDCTGRDHAGFGLNRCLWGRADGERLSGHTELGCTKALIRFLEDSLRVFEIKRAFFQRLRVPFATGDREERPWESQCSPAGSRAKVFDIYRVLLF
jgi:hypothetical protein